MFQVRMWSNCYLLLPNQYLTAQIQCSFNANLLNHNIYTVTLEIYKTCNPNDKKNNICIIKTFTSKWQVIATSCKEIFFHLNTWNYFCINILSYWRHILVAFFILMWICVIQICMKEIFHIIMCKRDTLRGKGWNKRMWGECSFNFLNQVTFSNARKPYNRVGGFSDVAVAVQFITFYCSFSVLQQQI